MHKVNRQAIVRHHPKKMFDIVNAVELYPIFLKWCHAAQIIEENADFMIAGLTVSLAGIKQKFTTKNILKQKTPDYQIDLSLVTGPFETLSGYWYFTYLNDAASKIELHLEFNFKSGILNSAFKRAFGTIAQQLVADFVKRANHVYR
ncbi:MAG: ubiquinone-binding protein [Proteobacteria bacterium]|nr:ubiquinone-binding protein [Pseudomonadota bacterium]